SSPPQPTARSATPVGGAPTRVPRALVLLADERYADAEATLGPEPAASTSDELLLRAVLRTHGGDVEEAEQLLDRLFSRDELNPGAHYLKALCREHAQDPATAARHYQLAIYLDPAFALPYLHLGQLARRTGALADARRELGRSLVLLEREDAAR